MSERTLRGGSYYFVTGLIRRASRVRSDPKVRRRKYGLRLVIRRKP
jgi:hypothetical protein